ncbi:hypothetical protein FC36_GL002102 [Ligilactobacillus equi DSM 15833 = JCM 10991]|uniref:Uncharacterized protein n=1 Tax=Ligilactobacillus equi DSM 15833 = JCM 10991 TaxID=1423740 RepID=A0A0R1THT2_9LACO|nr:hypothetical protein FC36_GL002102 [Ligilactobacillus equi DSM 15833 = JCM 10991]
MRIRPIVIGRKTKKQNIFLRGESPPFDCFTGGTDAFICGAGDDLNYLKSSVSY